MGDLFGLWSPFPHGKSWWRRHAFSGARSPWVGACVRWYWLAFGLLSRSLTLLGFRTSCASITTTHIQFPSDICWPSTNQCSAWHQHHPGEGNLGLTQKLNSRIRRVMGAAASWVRGGVTGDRAQVEESMQSSIKDTVAIALPKNLGIV